MKLILHFFISALCLVFLAGLAGCQKAEGNQTGSEFIPDMAHATAYEANVLTKYSFNTWDEESTFSRRTLSQPRQPVNGTIPRGYSGVASNDGIYSSAEAAVLSTMSKNTHDRKVPYTPNGSAPYYYPDTEEGRTQATQNILYNPYPITKDGLEKGKELYEIYCGICHGDKGDGAGYLVRDNGGKYPAQPAIFTDSAFVFSSNGRYYHGIMYGKNAMGGYADKLSYEERWQVIHYIRSLQATARKVNYDENANGLKAEFGVPMAQAKLLAAKPEPPVNTPPVEQTQSEDGHSHEGGGH
jgi:mono/diheme cytochrome c family protein